jgi:hypothetical protein
LLRSAQSQRQPNQKQTQEDARQSGVAEYGQKQHQQRDPGKGRNERANGQRECQQCRFAHCLIVHLASPE